MYYIIVLANGKIFACGPSGEETQQIFVTRESAQRWVELLTPEYPGCKVMLYNDYDREVNYGN